MTIVSQKYERCTLMLHNKNTAQDLVIVAGNNIIFVNESTNDARARADELRKKNCQQLHTNRSFYRKLQFLILHGSSLYVLTIIDIEKCNT